MYGYINPGLMAKHGVRIDPPRLHPGVKWVARVVGMQEITRSSRHILHKGGLVVADPRISLAFAWKDVSATAGAVPASNPMSSFAQLHCHHTAWSGIQLDAQNAPDPSYCFFWSGEHKDTLIASEYAIVGVIDNHVTLALSWELVPAPRVR